MCRFGVIPAPDRRAVQLAHVLRALASRFAVEVLTLGMPNLPHIEHFHKTRLLRVPAPGGRLADRVETFRRALRRQLDGADYDVVHFCDPWSGVPVVERKAELGLRTVYACDSIEGLASDHAVCIKDADLVLTATDAGQKLLADTDRVLVVPPGVDIDRFDIEPEDTGAPPQVLYAGALGPGRGLWVLLRAFRTVLSRISARLVLIGPAAPGFLQRLGSGVEQLGLAGHVTVSPPVGHEDMPRVLSAATVCVAPTAPDRDLQPFSCVPMKVLEYLACRRATVAARRSTVERVLRDGVDGLLFEPESAQDLAEKLLLVLSDAELRDRLARSGQRRVRDRFSAGALRRHLLEGYARILPKAAWLKVSPAVPASFAEAAPESDSLAGSLGGETATVMTNAPPELVSDIPTAPGVASEPWVVPEAAGILSGDTAETALAEDSFVAAGDLLGSISSDRGKDPW